MPAVCRKVACVVDPEDQVAASIKSRAKRSRWGPDQPTSSSPSHTGKAWPPASGFKGVNSHRPPGALLPSRPANPALIAPKQASEQPHTVPQSDPVDPGRQHASPPAHPLTATALTKNDIVQPFQSARADQSRHGVAHGGSNRTAPMHGHNGVPARKPSTPPTDHAVMHQEHTQSSNGGNTYLKSSSRVDDRERAACGERARHTPSKHSRLRDYHKSHLQTEAEEILCTSVMSADRPRSGSRQYHASRSYHDDSSQDGKSKAREPDR